MIRDFELLVKLQEIDSEVTSLKNAKKEFPIRKQKLEDEIALSVATVENSQRKCTEIVQEKKMLKDQVETITAKLSKSQDRINSITSNREYDAVHSEIEQNKKTLTLSETRQLRIDEEEVRLATALVETQTELEKIKEMHAAEIQQLTSKIGELDAAIAIQVKAREDLLPSIGKHILRTYDHILGRKKDGYVLSMVTQSTRYCQRCHKMLETQRFNEVRKGTLLQTCGGCGSILIWDDEGKKV